MLLDPADQDVAEIGVAQHLGALEDGQRDRHAGRGQGGVERLMGLEAEREARRADRPRSSGSGGDSRPAAVRRCHSVSRACRGAGGRSRRRQSAPAPRPAAAARRRSCFSRPLDPASAIDCLSAHRVKVSLILLRQARRHAPAAAPRRRTRRHKRTGRRGRHATGRECAKGSISQIMPLRSARNRLPRTLRPSVSMRERDQEGEGGEGEQDHAPAVRRHRP